MTKRCKHEYDTKAGYPNDVICHQCQTIWTLTDYLEWSDKQLLLLPKYIRAGVRNLKEARV